MTQRWPWHSTHAAVTSHQSQLPPLTSFLGPQEALTHEFRELRAAVEQMGLLRSDHLFFLLYLLHILLLDVAAWLTLRIFGTSLVPFLLCAVLLSVVQVTVPLGPCCSCPWGVLYLHIRFPSSLSSRSLQGSHLPVGQEGL